MATKKSIANAFESQLAIALKSASITAAAIVVKSNPDITLEDFYTLVKPQGFPENITLGELVQALSGDSVRLSIIHPGVSTQQAPAKTKKKSAAVVAKGKPRKPSKLPEVSCMTKAGQEAYHRSILEYLTAVDDWVRSPDIMEHCGGDSSQIGTAMRKHLIPTGMVKSKGKTYGLHFAITSKGRRKAVSGSAVTASRPAPVKSGASKKRADAVDIGDDSRTQAARDAYRAVVLKFLRGNKWQSGPEISAACGGNAARRKRVLRNLIEAGVVEHNGKMTGGARWRLARKKS